VYGGLGGGFYELEISHTTTDDSQTKTPNSDGTVGSPFEVDGFPLSITLILAGLGIVSILYRKRLNH